MTILEIKPSRLLFFNGLAVFIGPVVDAADHSHHLLQVSLGLTRTFRVKIGPKWHEERALLIAPNIRHQFDGRDDRQVVVLMDPESSAARNMIDFHLKDRPFASVPWEDVQPTVSDFREIDGREPSCAEINHLCQKLGSALGNPAPAPFEMDHRIERVIDLMKDLPIKRISAHDLADRVYLSEGRLSHLFKEQIGIPIRRYLLWLRLMEALKQIFHGTAFITAAHETGFSDQAHLSRTFKGMFGYSLAEIFKSAKDSRFVQAITCLG